MIRFLRGLIYGIAAGLTAAIVLEYLDDGRRVGRSERPLLSGGTNAAPGSDADENLSDDARQALIDELSAQL